MNKLSIAVVIFALLFLIFSCHRSLHDLNDKDIDSISDLDIIADADEFFENEADDSDDSDDFDDTGEPDEDFSDSDNESDILSFKTRPHGITRWDETYSYFIRCKPEKDLKTVISVSKDDTCGGYFVSLGSINSNTYSFTPTKVKFPDGRCSIAVECSDGKNKISQKTQIQIPNPFELPKPVKEILNPKILWSNQQQAVFIHENELYSINRELDSVTLLDENLLEKMTTYSTDEFFYYISKDGNNIIKTDGTAENTSTIPIPGERTYTTIYRVTENGDVVFSTLEDEISPELLWFYDHKENTVSLIDLPDEIQNYFSLCDDTGCVFSGSKQPAFLFNLIPMEGEQVCSLFSGFNQFDKPLYMNGKLYYRKNYEKCTTALEISTCTEEKIGKCTGSSYFAKIKKEAGKNYFHIFNYDENETQITLFSSDGTTKTATFDRYIHNFETKDGVHLYYIPNDIHKTNDPYNCLKILNLEDGSVVTPELKCRPFDSFSQIGFFGETAFFNRLSEKLTHQFFEVDNNGTFLEKSMKVGFQPSEYTFSLATGSNGNDFFILKTDYSNQIFKTDGTPENTKHIRNTLGKTISITDEYIVNYVKFTSEYQNSSLNVYNLETDELLFTAIADPCSTSSDVFSPGTVYDGAGSYNLNIGKLSFFGTSHSQKCGYYTLWSTDGTSEGTVNHLISLKIDAKLIINDNVFPDSKNGVYLSLGAVYYIDKNGSKAVKNGLIGYKVLGIVDDKCIAYKTENSKIQEIVVLKYGKIIDRLLPSENTVFSNISMSGKIVQLLETVTVEKDVFTNILYFPDVDISKKQVRTKLFDGDYSAGSNVLGDKNTFFYSVSLYGQYVKQMLGATFNDGNSISVFEPFLNYYDDQSADDFTAMAIIGNNFIFNWKNFLKATPYKNGRTTPFKLAKTEGKLEYSGKSFSGKAVITQIITDSSKTALIVTDGTVENTGTALLPSLKTEIFMWNGWILKDKRWFVIEEDDFRNIAILESPSDNIDISQSTQNIYFTQQIGRLEDAFFVYRLPKNN